MIRVLAQAVGFAFLAAISPTALLVMAVFLSSANPRRNAMSYNAGAVVITVIGAVAAYFVLRAAGLNLPTGHDPRYGLRLGLGVLALAGAAVIRRRKQPALPEPPRLTEPPGLAEPEQERRGFISRLTAQPTPRTAFITGLIVFAPGVTFLAAVQVIATANTGVLETAAGLVIVVVVSVLFVWVPLLTYLAAPDATTDRLKAINGWLRTNAKAVAIGALAVAGIVLIVNGALGLAGVL